VALTKLQYKNITEKLQSELSLLGMQGMIWMIEYVD
jgi:hypothetical protein